MGLVLLGLREVGACLEAFGYEPLAHHLWGVSISCEDDHRGLSFSSPL